VTIPEPLYKILGFSVPESVRDDAPPVCEEKVMGISAAHNIEKAGLYLLAILKVEGSVHFSRFYDGTEEMEETLLRGMSFGPAIDGEAEDDYVPENATSLMDIAAEELARGGIVKTTYLDELLAQEVQDYLIELTDKGRAFLDRGERFRFWDAE
jgi:hypothetical protein